LVRNEIVEEDFQVGVEVGDVSVLGDERQNLPVAVGTFPKVPGVTGEADAFSSDGANRLNTSLTRKPDHNFVGRGVRSRSAS